MSKLRVYEIAKELGIEQHELVQRLAALGIPVNNHMSVLEPAQAERLRKSFSQQEKPEQKVEEHIRPTVVRRRKKGAEEQSEAQVSIQAAPVAPPAHAPQEPTSSRHPSTPAEARTHASTSSRAPDVAQVSSPQSVASEPPHSDAPTSFARGSDSPSAPPSDRPSDRFAHDPLPPGVMRRGKAVAPSAAPLPEQARRRIVEEHAALHADAPRRREIVGRTAIGPTGRGTGRVGKKKPQMGARTAPAAPTVPSAQKRVIRIEDQIQVQALAQRMSIKATELLMKLMKLGMSGVHINSTLDADTAAVLASEFNYEVENIARSEAQIIGDARGEFTDTEAKRVMRPPVVTVMGHVDHGKTSLLDKIRETNVAGGEAGGITQHIGAYRVDTKKGTIVFLDTPGHEAFTAMRARGAQATDIVVLVCAADDGPMPQTKEAINHAKAAKVPVIVAVNKMDKPTAQPERVKNELSALGLQPEEWGGDVMFVACSAITGAGVDQLLDSILLQAEVLDLKANPEIPAEGVVLEAYLDKGRGPVANVLVRNGTLEPGDYVVAGGAWGRIRAMTDDRGGPVKTAGPATPVEVLGFQDLPGAGDVFYEVTNQRKAQEVASAQGGPTKKVMAAGPRGLDKLQQMLDNSEQVVLRLVVKADVQGSIEALQKALTDLSTEKVQVEVIHTGVGGITENDVMLASASSAIVIGFSVRPQGKATSTAKNENVEIRTYTIIYEALDDVKLAMKGLLSPTTVENELGKAEVREVFSIPKIGAIAGCMVQSGKIVRTARARLVRDAVVVWQGPIASLRRFKDDVKEVGEGFECGIGLRGFNDIKPGDIIEGYEEAKQEATLE